MRISKQWMIQCTINLKKQTKPWRCQTKPNSWLVWISKGLPFQKVSSVWVLLPDATWQSNWAWKPSACPFRFLFEDFRFCFLCSNFFSVLLLLLAGSLVPKFHFQLTQKKVKERSPKRSDKVQFGRWRDSFSSALYALYSDRARSSNQLQRGFYPSFNTKISNETKPELEDLSSIVNICLLWNIHELL